MMHQFPGAQHCCTFHQLAPAIAGFQTLCWGSEPANGRQLPRNVQPQCIAAVITTTSLKSANKSFPSNSFHPHAVATAGGCRDPRINSDSSCPGKGAPASNSVNEWSKFWCACIVWNAKECNSLGQVRPLQKPALHMCTTAPKVSPETGPWHF
jgi:hypothetical protein